MTVELVLFLTFVILHFFTAATLTAISNWFNSHEKWRTTAANNYLVWIGIYLFATLYPILQTCWLAESLSISMEKTQPVAAMNISSPKPVTNSLSVAGLQATPATTVGASSEFVLVSNSSNGFYIADQLAYLLVPVFELIAAVVVIGIAVSLIRILKLLAATSWLVHRSSKFQLPVKLQYAIPTPVLTNTTIATPMAVGVLRPAILIPSEFLNQQDEKLLHHVLLHEQAHHQRFDLATSLLLKIISCLYWWSPALKPINKNIGLYREMACDDLAAGHVGDYMAYAQSLLDCAKITANRSNYISLALIGHDSDLSQRITGLINIRNPQKSIKWAMMVLMLVSLLAGSYISNLSKALGDNKPFVSIIREHQLLNTDHGRELLGAIEQENEVELERVLSQQVNPNIPIARQGTALMVAVKNQSIKMVQKLLSLGADPNQAAIRLGNPLIIAAMLGDIQIAAMLIDAGADVNAVVPRDETPLIAAARENQLEMVKYLIAMGAKPDLGVRVSAFDRFEYRTPLSETNREEIRKQLLLAVN